MTRDPYNRLVASAGWKHGRMLGANKLRVAGPVHLKEGDFCVEGGLVRLYAWSAGRSDPCSHTWYLWCPVDHRPLPADSGPCPVCHVWKTKDGEVFHWHELGDQHLLNIAAMLQSGSRHSREKAIQNARQVKVGEADLSLLDFEERLDEIREGTVVTVFGWKLTYLRRQKLSYALAEMRYRALIPTQDELRVAWDLCEAKGLHVQDGKPRHLLSVWAKVGLELRST